MKLLKACGYYISKSGRVRKAYKLWNNKTHSYSRSSVNSQKESIKGEKIYKTKKQVEEKLKKLKSNKTKSKQTKSKQTKSKKTKSKKTKFGSGSLEDLLSSAHGPGNVEQRMRKFHEHISQLCNTPIKTDIQIEKLAKMYKTWWSWYLGVPNFKENPDKIPEVLSELTNVIDYKNIDDLFMSIVKNKPDEICKLLEKDSREIFS